MISLMAAVKEHPTLTVLRELYTAVEQERRMRETRRTPWDINRAEIATRRAMDKAADRLRREGVEI